MFNQLKIRARINLLFAAIVVIVLVFMGGLLSYYQKQQQREANQALYSSEIQDIDNIFSAFNQSNKDQVEAAIGFAQYYLKSLGEIQETTIQLELDAVNQLTQKRSKVQVNQWVINGQQAHYNEELVSTLARFTTTEVGILQKIPRGYIRISTTTSLNNEISDIGTYIPNSSRVVETVERGQTYLGTALENGRLYQTAYIPLLINQEVKGMLFLGVPRLNQRVLKQVFNNRDYRGQGHFILLSKEGIVLHHPTQTGANYSQNPVYRNMVASGDKVRTFRYLHRTEDGQTQWHRVYYKYNQTFDAYLAVNLAESAMKASQVNVFRQIFLPSLGLLLFFALLVWVGTRRFQKHLEAIIEKIHRLADGQIPGKLGIKANDEIGHISQALDRLIEGVRGTTTFADEIKNGNLSAEYTPQSDEDITGNSLLEMRNSLIEARENEQKRNEATQKQQWLNEGIAMFSDILRSESRDIKKLAYQLISELVKYMNAKQGGFFVVNDMEKQEPDIELYASYAFGKERMLKKTFPWGVGLIGRCMQEKKLIHITEIPDDYADIASGLGQSQPRAVMSFPLIANEQVLGAIELASFKDFTPTQIEFANRLAESIAITLITMQSNLKTSQLLENSKKQAEELASQEEEMRQNLEELQATQESAARREAEMSSIIEALNMTNLVMHFDINGVIEDINKNYLRLLEVNHEEVVGLTIDFLIPPNQKKQHIKTWERVKRGEMIRKKTRYEFRDKSIQVTETLTPVADEEGNFYKVLSISSKDADEELY